MKSSEIESIALPKNIKAEIQENVIELKELLKNDMEFAENLIRMICKAGAGITPESLCLSVYQHYDNIIKNAQHEYKAGA